jgi:hypothetical protein
MHCPQCGQQQVSSDIRFCSRCGFALAAVTSLLASGGTTQLEQKVDSPKRRGVKQGAILLFIAMAIAPFSAIMFEEAGAAIIGTLFMAGFMRMLYAAVFQEGRKRQSLSAPPQQQSLYQPAQQQALPPTYEPPTAVPPRVNTAEMVIPPSVTEHTTRLLDKDQESEE